MAAIGVAERLGDAIKARRLSIRAAAKECGVRYASLYRATQPGAETGVDLVLQVANGLGLSLEWLVRGEGTMDRGASTPEADQARAEGERRALELVRKAIDAAAEKAGLGVAPLPRLSGAAIEELAGQAEKGFRTLDAGAKSKRKKKAG